MNLHLRPILSALLRNRTGALLVSIQIAVALAILVNAVYMVQQRVAKIGQPTGLDIDNLFVIRSAAFTPEFNVVAAIREDLDYLRSLKGVHAATATNAIPLSGGGSTTTLWSKMGVRTGGQEVATLEVDEHGIDTLGTPLIAGRNFRHEEIL